MSQLPTVVKQDAELVSADDLQRQLAVITTVDEGQNIEDLGRRMRDAILLAGKGVEKANEFAVVACEAGVKIGVFLDPTVSPRQRTDLTVTGHGQLDGSRQMRSNYRNLARISPEKRQSFYDKMKEIQEIISKSGLLRRVKREPGERTDLTSFDDQTRLQAAISESRLTRDAAYRYEVMSHCQNKVMESYFAECRAKRHPKQDKNEALAVWRLLKGDLRLK